MDNIIGILGTGTIDKQTGGPGQFARVEVEIYPNEDKTTNSVINRIVGGTIPTEFVKSTIEGCMAALMVGPLAKYPVVGVCVHITGGKSHPIDSNAQAFGEAGRLAVLDALSKAEMTILEPIGKLEVTLPTEYTGTVQGDISRRRGIVENLEVNGTSAVITAILPLRESFGYTTDLRSLTQGRASGVLTPSGYSEAPKSVADTIIASNMG